MEGRAPFTPPSRPTLQCETWYMIVGPLTGKQPPVFILHGGPSGCHEYMLPHKELVEDYDIPLIFYDQIGNGNSTRLPQLAGDEAFWQPSLFVAELANLIQHVHKTHYSSSPTNFRYDLLGNSWGGMLASTFALTARPRPSGLRRLVLYSTSASIADLNADAMALLAAMPDAERATLEAGEAACVAGDRAAIRTPEFRAALGLFYRRHACRTNPFPPPELLQSFEHIEADPTVYEALWGTGSEFTVTGTLRDWDVRDRLPDIDVPVLLINGEHDSAGPTCQKPFLDKVPRLKVVLLKDASHNGHLEVPEVYFDAVSGFLLAPDQ